MKKSTAIRFVCFFAASILVGAGAYLSLWQLKARMTETAFSLCAKELRFGGGQSIQNARNYLVFSALSEDGKQSILSAMEENNPYLANLAERLEFFAYSERNMRDLEREVRENLSAAAAAVSLTDDRGKRADALCKALFGNRIHFREENNKNGFAKRYYCGNITIAERDDGVLLYQCDLRSKAVDEKLYRHLFGESIPFSESVRPIGNYLEKVLQSSDVKATFFVELESGCITAAKIEFPA